MIAIGFTTATTPIEPREMHDYGGVPFTADRMRWAVTTYEDLTPIADLTYFGVDSDGKQTNRTVYNDSRGFPAGHPQPPQWALDALAEAWAEWDERQEQE